MLELSWLGAVRREFDAPGGAIFVLAVAALAAIARVISTATFSSDNIVQLCLGVGF